MNPNKLTLSREMRHDNVYPLSKVVDVKELTGFTPRKGLEKAIISNDKIVNFVAKGYGHLTTQQFFGTVENKLQAAGLQYETRSINRDDRSFAVDYILTDERYLAVMKNGNGTKGIDYIKPMLRFVTSYDGSNSAMGFFGHFRQVCTNGLMAHKFDIGFKVKHRGNIVEVVMPEISNIFEKFMSNDYYSLHRKFEVLQERIIPNLKDFVKMTANDLKVFKYEASDKNPEPSLNAEIVLNIIREEARQGGFPEPTYWHGYNAFNELLGTRLQKTFDQSRRLDAKIFDKVYELATAAN